MHDPLSELKQAHGEIDEDSLRFVLRRFGLQVNHFKTDPGDCVHVVGKWGGDFIWGFTIPMHDWANLRFTSLPATPYAFSSIVTGVMLALADLWSGRVQLKTRSDAVIELRPVGEESKVQLVLPDGRTGEVQLYKMQRLLQWMQDLPEGLLLVIFQEPTDLPPYKLLSILWGKPGVQGGVAELRCGDLGIVEQVNLSDLRVALRIITVAQGTHFSHQETEHDNRRTVRRPAQRY